jgi:hypothetical protein
MPRFVVLEHDHPELHWDFMLEFGAVLRTWRLAAPPQAGYAIRATASFDHRLLYLDYEGAISGGRGSVKRWDHGTFDWLEQVPRQLIVRLDGERLKGTLHLEQGEAEQWSGKFEEEASGG